MRQKTRLSKKRLETFDELHGLKVKKLNAEITKNRLAGELSDVALARLTAPIGDDGYHYILPSQGIIKFMCPHCGRTIAECDTYRAHRYLPNKLKLVNHLSDLHNVPAYKFDAYTQGYFTRLELQIFHRTYPAVPLLREYAEGEFFDDGTGPKELPAP